MTKEWEKPEDLRRRKPVLWLTMTALFMAMVVVLSMSALSIPVPGGHLYFNDVVIDTAAMLMDPLSAFIACGVGAFLGDLLFYPAPMFVSLITHGLQALVISLLCRKLRMKQPLACAIAVLAGAIVMVVGYTLGRAFVYSTPEYAIMKLPFQCLQAHQGVGGAGGVEALPEGSAAAGTAVVPACRSGDGAGVLPAGMGAVRHCIGSRGDWPECGAGHRGRADWDAVPADYAPAGARGEGVTNRDANGFPLWKTLASFFNDAEKSPDRGQIRRKMCYNSILERDTLSPETETRCKETLREIVR